MIAYEYSLEGYISLLFAFAKREYKAMPLTQIDPGQPHLFLRHDVDMCLDRALIVAEAEAAAGVSADYYVLVRTEMYNVASKAGRSAVRKITELGHRVGLHFDPSGLPDGLEVLDREAAVDCAMLEATVGAPVQSISFHRPAPHLQGLQASIAGRPHVYQPRYFADIGYCSDSAGGFHHHHPLEHPSVDAKSALQLLTHPIWWVDSAASPRAKLDHFLTGKVEMLRQELAANCKVYR
jgi:hypothetical protein